MRFFAAGFFAIFFFAFAFAFTAALAILFPSLLSISPNQFERNDIEQVRIIC